MAVVINRNEVKMEKPSTDEEIVANVIQRTRTRTRTRPHMPAYFQPLPPIAPELLNAKCNLMMLKMISLLIQLLRCINYSDRMSRMFQSI